MSEKKSKLNLNDRETIEIVIIRKQSLKRIAVMLKKHAASIARVIKRHRIFIPKGTSLNPYTQEDITLLVNHINSTKRPGLNNLSPYEMIPDDDEDMKKLMKLLDLKPITAKEVNLTKELLNK